MDELKNSVIGWVEHDNEIENYKTEISKIKDKINILIENRNKYESSLIKSIESNKLTNNDIVISDGSLKYSTSTTSQPITKKYLEKKLKEYFKNEEKASELLEIIYNERDKKTKTSIKRVYKYNKLFMYDSMQGRLQ